jgi:succinate dehydrogenase cytochrome b556 subunit
MSAPAPAHRSRLGYPLLSWYFMRVSGVLMLVLVLGHLGVMHYLHAPSQTDSAFVAARWSQLFWLTFDWMLLLVALLHGLAGVQAVFNDYLHPARARQVVAAVIGLVALLFFGLGSAAILSFDPQRLQSGQGPLSTQTWLVPALDLLLEVLATLTYLAVLAVLVVFADRRRRGLPVGPWSFAGQWAWALHRLTGLAIVAFLLVHILDILLLPLAPVLYDRTIASYASPYLIPMEVALVAAILYHAFNGVRLMLIEFGSRSLKLRQAGLFFGVLATTAILLLPSIVVLLRAAR